MNRLRFSQKALNVRSRRMWHRMRMGCIIASVICFAISAYSLLFSHHPKDVQFFQNDDFRGFVEPTETKTTESIMARDPLTGVPFHIVVNGEKWDINLIDSYPDAAGRKGVFGGIQAQTTCRTKTITYIRTEDPALLRANIMHEVMHAGACVHGGDTWWNSINSTRFDHKGVYHLGEFLAPFMRDNPIFVDWMKVS